MNCPHCGETISSVSCQRCGEKIPEKSLFCCWCGNPVKKEDPIDPEDRIPCSDGTCVGIINENKVCNLCGKPYAGGPVSERRRQEMAAELCGQSE